ncbi:MAG: hypothetical protein KAJ69_04605, partial [Thermoplasmatales archaeon]|nr:hypothetical protein [Thermoplasmatales archaeon]
MPKRLELGIVVAVIILSLIGLAMIFSTAGSALFFKQTIWLIIAVIIAFIFSKISPRIWLNLAPLIYIG